MPLVSICMALFVDEGAYSLNSGVVLYFSNSSSHSALESGGRIPVMGRHSVILRPDSVRRVTPPTTITAKTNADEPRSQRPTDGGESTGKGTGCAANRALLAEKKRGSKSRVSFGCGGEKTV